MQAFGRRAACLAAARFDAKLMGLEPPRPRTTSQGLEELAAEHQHRLERRTACDLWRDRLEPPGDAAVDRVVFERLIVRLVGLPLDGRSGESAEHRVAPAPIS